jgi:hypothetical protein
VGPERLLVSLAVPFLLGGRAADLRDIFCGLLGLGPGIGLVFATASIWRPMPARTRRSGLTDGFQSAFLACAVLAGIGLALALLLLGRRRGDKLVEPVPERARS